MTDPTVRETQRELRLVVLALVVLGLGAAAVCNLDRRTVTRIRKPNQPPPREVDGRSLSIPGAKLALPVELLLVPQLHHGPLRFPAYCASADVWISEPGDGRFLRLRRFPWDRRYVVSG